jgi:hypothetical protein
MSDSQSPTPSFIAGQTLLLLPTLKHALMQWPGLADRLARAQLYAMHAEALPQQLGCALSLAAVKLAGTHSRWGHDKLKAGRFACADLAQLRVELNGVRAIAIGNIALTEPMDQLATELLQSCIVDTGMLLHRICVGQYVLELPDGMASPVALAPSQLIGSALSGQLPEPVRWRSLLNESQMLLAQSAALPCNSLWFYGADIPSQCSHAAISVHLASATSDPLLLGLQALNPPAPQPALHIFDWRAPSNLSRELPKQSLWISCDSGELFFANRFDTLKFWRNKRSFTATREHAPK